MSNSFLYVSFGGSNYSTQLCHRDIDSGELDIVMSQQQNTPRIPSPDVFLFTVSKWILACDLVKGSLWHLTIATIKHTHKPTTIHRLQGGSVECEMILLSCRLSQIYFPTNRLWQVCVCVRVRPLSYIHLPNALGIKVAICFWRGISTLVN